MSSSLIHHLRLLVSAMGLCLALVVACNGTTMPAVAPTGLAADRAEEVGVAAVAATTTSGVPATPSVTATVQADVTPTESVASASSAVETFASPTPVPTATVAPTADAVPTSGGDVTPAAPTPEPTATESPPTEEVVTQPTPTPETQEVPEETATATPGLETPLPELEATVAVATVQPTMTVDYFEGFVEPCESASGGSAPCESGRAIEFERAVSASSVLPDRPPSLEEVLFNSWGLRDLDEVSNLELLTATHIVARGRFQADSVVCQGYPVLNPGWAVDVSDFGIPEPGPDDTVFLDFGIYHWMCFATLQVHEYMIGKGGPTVTVMLAASGIPYYDEAEPDSPEVQASLELHREAVSDHFVGPEWVVWLAPSYTAAVESWTAYNLWGVQRGDDGIVRVISPEADYYEDIEGLEYDYSHLKAPFVEFRQLIADADSSRVERTSGRIGVGADTPMLVQDALRLSDYYQEIGASEFAMIPPTPHPTGQ